MITHLSSGRLLKCARIPSMPKLPTGTVTFLFSDIEGSTRLEQAIGGAA